MDEAVQERIAVIENASRDDILAKSPKSTEEMDNLGSIFFTTGNEEAVEKVASILYLMKRGKVADTMLGEGAFTDKLWALPSTLLKFTRDAG